VHLVPCKPPVGPLERAPATSLRDPVTGGPCEGFWGVDERYYACCRRPDGATEWFRIADEGTRPRRAARQADVLPFPAPALPRLIVGRYRGAAMLVGTRRRRPGRVR
jgi:hypothetical protein